MNEKDLLQLKERIQESKQEKAKLEGKIAHLLEELKTNFNCTSISSAKTMLDEMETEIEELKKELKTISNEIHQKYDIV